MVALLFVFMVAAVVTLNPAEQPPAPLPEPAPVVIEKTVVIECMPIQGNERLERDLTRPFEQKHYFNPQGDGCRKKSETSTTSSPQVTTGVGQIQHGIEGEKQP